MKNNSTAGIVIGVVLVVAIAWANTSKSPQSQQPSTSAVAADNLVGKSLPDITLTDRTGQVYNLAGLRGKNTVLFFSEGLKCYPACWDQMAAFATDARFNSDDTVAISVIADPPQDWQQAAAKMPKLAQATVLFDTKLDAARQMGLLSMPSSMHGGQFPGHTYVLLDKQSIVRKVIDDVSMSVNNEKIIKEFASLYQ